MDGGMSEGGQQLRRVLRSAVVELGEGEPSYGRAFFLSRGGGRGFNVCLAKDRFVSNNESLILALLINLPPLLHAFFCVPVLYVYHGIQYDTEF